MGGSHDSHYVRVKKQTKPEFKKKYDLPEEDFYPADPNDELQGKNVDASALGALSLLPSFSYHSSRPRLLPHLFCHPPLTYIFVYTDTFDEIVIFETERCLPRYALTFKR